MRTIIAKNSNILTHSILLLNKLILYYYYLYLFPPHLSDLIVDLSNHVLKKVTMINNSLESKCIIIRNFTNIHIVAFSLQLVFSNFIFYPTL